MIVTEDRRTLAKDITPQITCHELPKFKSIFSRLELVYVLPLKSWGARRASVRQTKREGTVSVGCHPAPVLFFFTVPTLASFT